MMDRIFSGCGNFSLKRVIFVSVLLLLPLLHTDASSGRKVLLDSRTKKAVKYSADDKDKRIVTIPYRFRHIPGEFRGVWVTTAWNLDFPRTATVAQFQTQYRTLLFQLKKYGINTVIFQVRPQCDAFYISRENPVSAFLCGAEGRGLPGFDPMNFMVRETRRQGMKFHAWLNPYRVRANITEGKAAALKKLSPSSFARRFPDAVLEVPQGNKKLLMLDPGHPRTFAHLLDTVREILWKYDVDGIHFDDYFYPYGGIGNSDLASYRKFCRDKKLTVEMWRRNNVDSLIFNVGKLVRTHNRLNRKKVEFGVSPFGIWLNRKNNPLGSPTKGMESYSIQFADSRRWVKQNWVDYIAPQLYWSFSEPNAPFASVVDWWAQTVAGTNVKFYPGLALNKYLPNKVFWESPEELKNQLIYSSALPQVKGYVFFSARHIFNPANSLLRQNTSSAFALFRNGAGK